MSLLIMIGFLVVMLGAGVMDRSQNRVVRRIGDVIMTLGFLWFIASSMKGDWLSF
jgi:hypothetical protein